VNTPRTLLLPLGEDRPTIEVLEAGDGPPLVFLHGAGGIPAWVGVLPLLAERFHVLAPLLPGMEEPPHPMRLGDDEGDYYRGTFRSPTAGDAVDQGEEVSS